YNPGQGRYITQDPIGLAGGLNSYQYPLNPVQSVDPLGLNTIALGAGAGAAVGGIIGAVAGVGLYFAATSNSESEEQAKTQVLSCATTRPKCLEATPENIRQVV
ncbi:RHS repeat-associated core domain-containing protein, partial [Salmonella enterica subsp. enterica]